MEDLSLDLCMYLKKMDYDGKHTYSFTYENNRNISGSTFRFTTTHQIIWRR